MKKCVLSVLLALCLTAGLAANVWAAPATPEYAASPSTAAPTAPTAEPTAEPAAAEQNAPALVKLTKAQILSTENRYANTSAVLFPVVNIDQQIEYPDRFSLTHIDPKRRLGGHIAVNESAICWGEQVLSSRSMGLLHSFFVISYKFRLG